MLDVPEAATGFDMVEPGAAVEPGVAAAPELFVLGPAGDPGVFALDAPGVAAFMLLDVDELDVFGPLGDAEDELGPFVPAEFIVELAPGPDGAEPPGAVLAPDPVAVEIPPGACEYPPPAGAEAPPGRLPEEETAPPPPPSGEAGCATLTFAVLGALGFSDASTAQEMSAMAITAAATQVHICLRPIPGRAPGASATLFTLLLAMTDSL